MYENNYSTENKNGNESINKRRDKNSKEEIKMKSTESCKTNFKPLEKLGLKYIKYTNLLFTVKILY